MERILTIENTNGLHTILAAEVVRAANQYTADIILVYQDKAVDVKSILGLISLAIPQGKDVRIIVRGTNEERSNRILDMLEAVLSKEEK